jgi:putative ABC transport system ATP-binding protein
VIHALGVGVRAGGEVLLAPVTLHVPAGHVVAVSGPSGSGKSTLLKCLAGHLRPSEGEVRIGGQDIWALSEGRRAAFRRAQVGQVFQESDLLEELTVAENVALPFLFNGLGRTEAMERAEAVLADVDCHRLADRRPSTLSVGQAQRVAVARACITQGRVLLADEPTASLDRANAMRVGRLLVELARARGLAMVVTTHDPAVVALCDQEFPIMVRSGL